MEVETQIAIFKGKEIRKIIHNKEWRFSVVDVVGVLTDSPQLKTYWEQLKMVAEDGKMRETDCANTEGMLRISI